MTEQASAENKAQAGVVLTGVLAAASVATFVWAQRGPGFAWDPEAAQWIKDTIPGLKTIAALVAWPVARQWPFSVAVLGVVLALGASRHPRAAVEVLGAVAGGMLLYGALAALPVEIAPSQETLFYGTLFGGVSVSLAGDIKPQASAVLWIVTGVLTLLPGLALVSVGHPPSAWVISMLLVASWLAGLHQLIRA